MTTITDSMLSAAMIGLATAITQAQPAADHQQPPTRQETHAMIEALHDTLAEQATAVNVLAETNAKLEQQAKQLQGRIGLLRAQTTRLAPLAQQLAKVATERNQLRAEVERIRAELEAAKAQPDPAALQTIPPPFLGPAAIVPLHQVQAIRPSPWIAEDEEGNVSQAYYSEVITTGGQVFIDARPVHDLVRQLPLDVSDARLTVPQDTAQWWRTIRQTEADLRIRNEHLREALVQAMEAD